MFHNKALSYVSTEGEEAIKAYESAVNGTDNGKKSKKKTAGGTTENMKNQEDFEAMKKKTKKILFGMLAAVIATVAGAVIFKAVR